MIYFYNKYNIVLGHSIVYYQVGNGLAEPSNKILVDIIKKFLQENKRTCHRKLISAFLAHRVSTNKSIWMSPFQLVYGFDVVFPIYLGVPIMKLLQEAEVEPNDMQRRINQMIQLQEIREEVYNNTQLIQNNIKRIHDKRVQAGDFQIDDLMLKWDARNDEQGKRGNFEKLWKGPYKISTFHGNNAYLLKYLSLELLAGRPINGRLVKHYFT